MRLTSTLRTLFVFACVTALGMKALSAPLGCVSPQSLEFNMQGTILCSFGSNIKKVFWYDSIEDGTQSSPIIVFNKVQNETSGRGFQNQEYGITSEGNLVISKVSGNHERQYRVICIGSDDVTSIYVVEVRLIVFSHHDSPVIHGCEEEPCLQHFRSGEIITCSFKAAKPPAQLEWLEITENGASQIPSRLEVTKNVNGSFDAVAYTAVYFSDAVYIKYYSCELQWLAPEWTKYVNITAVSSSWHGNRDETYNEYVKMNGFAELQCGDDGGDLFIWKKLTLAGDLEEIGFLLRGQSTVDADYVNSLHINEEGNLVFENIGYEDEGKYVCLYSSKYHTKVNQIALVPIVLPSPPYLQVKQCRDSFVCSVHIRTESLTCSLDGVYPHGNLTWIPTDPTQLLFTNHETETKSHGKIFDLSTTSSFKLQRKILCEEQIFVKCQFSGPVAEFMQSSITVQIIRDEECYWLGKTNKHFNMTVALISSVSFLMLFIGFLCGKSIGREKYINIPQEENDKQDDDGSDGKLEEKTVADSV